MSSSDNIAIAPGGNTVERISNVRTSSANSCGRKLSMITSGTPARSPNRTL